ncbi:hypothetical protein E2C01_055483 [Portunus trituberculatus]|uniref:Uncharacterized protein n=1 Tax=Portunus trituberculatus TaxID=210409 RepID=A0A5B7GMU8_PORTR|nr:hypothetical protein [Portunus trituberculatus]
MCPSTEGVKNDTPPLHSSKATSSHHTGDTGARCGVQYMHPPPAESTTFLFTREQTQKMKRVVESDIPPLLSLKAPSPRHAGVTGKELRVRPPPALISSPQDSEKVELALFLVVEVVVVVQLPPPGSSRTQAKGGAVGSSRQHSNTLHRWSSN